jgi:hypothetical protein
MTGYDSPPPSGDDAAGSSPLSLDLLADLHAGVLDPVVTDELLRQVAADPQAQATLAALDAAVEATTAALSALPPLTIPENVAARIDAALRQEAAARFAAPTAVMDPPAPPPVAPVLDFATAARRRRRGVALAGGLLTAAAAVIGVVVVTGLNGGETTGTPGASATNSSDQALPPLALTDETLASAFDSTMAVTDYGPLGAPGRLGECLAAIQVDPASRPLGAREVTLDGDPGVLLILPTGTAGRLRLVVVEPECGPGRSAVLADTTIGG